MKRDYPYKIGIHTKNVIQRKIEEDEYGNILRDVIYGRTLIKKLQHKE